MNNKKTYILVIAVVIVIVGYFLYSQVIKPRLDDRMITTVVSTTIRSAELPLEFVYPSGEAAYTMIEPPVSTSTENGLQKIYLIMNNSAYLDYQKEQSGQVPPTVSVFVFKNPEQTEAEKEMEIGRITRLQNWANQYPQYTSFQSISSETEIVEIDGVRALRYRADGVYNQEVYLASYRDNTYVFTGQFVNETDDIYKMYNELISSIIFN